VLIDLNRSEFLLANITASSTFDRIPFNFGFGFLTGSQSIQFNLISVHLAAAEGSTLKRCDELKAIHIYAEQKVKSNMLAWNPYIILGDTNIQNKIELTNHLKWLPNFESLNDACKPTNISNTKPYDHVLIEKNFKKMIQADNCVTIVDIRAASGRTDLTNKEFEQQFSDHQLVYFDVKKFNQ